MYTDLFLIAAVTSGSILTCDSVLGDSLEFLQGGQGSYVFNGELGMALHVMQGNWASSQIKGEVSWFFLSYGGNLGYILK